MKNKKLTNTILRMVRADQKARKSNASIDFILTLDARNTETMRRVISQFGWPYTSVVGEKAADGAWLLVQHADQDPVFQKECLKLMLEAAKKGEAKKSNIAYLMDRILVRESKKQKYGTQFRISKTKRIISCPIADRKNLNKRRKQMQMGTYEDYYKLAVDSFKLRNPS
jgi:hypothetical protein